MLIIEEHQDVDGAILRSAGIECAHRLTDEADSPFEGIATDGIREILVHEQDLDAARGLLADHEV